MQHAPSTQPCLLVLDERVWATSLLEVVVMHVLCVCVCVCVCVFSSWLCCPLIFQNSPQTHLWEGFLLDGNFSFFTTPPGQVSVPKSFVSLFFFFLVFIFCPTSFPRESAAFLGAWYPPPTFKSCFLKVAQHLNELMVNF